MHIILGPFLWRSEFNSPSTHFMSLVSIWVDPVYCPGSGCWQETAMCPPVSLDTHGFVRLCNSCYLSLAVNYGTAKELLLLASSSTEQRKWISRLLKRIPRKPCTQSVAAPQEPPLGSQPSPLPSPHLSPRNSPKLTSRGAIRVHSRAPQASSKPRWVFFLH